MCLIDAGARGDPQVRTQFTSDPSHLTPRWAPIGKWRWLISLIAVTWFGPLLCSSIQKWRAYADLYLLKISRTCLYYNWAHRFVMRSYHGGDNGFLRIGVVTSHTYKAGILNPYWNNHYYCTMLFFWVVRSCCIRNFRNVGRKGIQSNSNMAQKFCWKWKTFIYLRLRFYKLVLHTLGI